MDRPDHRFLHEWHVQINRHQDKLHDAGKDRLPWMYDAKDLADEVPRMARLFKMERESSLPAMHRQCSFSESEHIPDNHLTCCLGVKCAECPILETIGEAEANPEDIDLMKAWTCGTHIIATPGFVDSSEGMILTVDDRMYWDRVYASLAMADEQGDT